MSRIDRRRGFRAAVLPMIAASALALTACAADTTGGEATDDTIKIGVFIPANSNAYLQAEEAAAKAAAEEFGVEIDVITSNWDSQAQNAAFQQAMQRGTYDAWVVNAISPAEQCDQILEAAESGIPVIIAITAICGDGGYTEGTVAFVGEQNAAGYDAWFAHIKENTPAGEIAVITGPALDFVTETTTAAAEKAFADGGDLKLASIQNTDYLTETAYAAAQTFLQSNPRLVAIASNYSGMTRGVVEAVAQSGRDILVYDSNGDAWTKEQIEAGTIAAALPGTPIADIKLAVQALLDHLDGKTVETVINPLDSLGYPNGPVLTSENVADWNPEY